MKVKISTSMVAPMQIKDQLRLTHERIKKILSENSQSPQLQAASMHLLSEPGKLVRPGLVFTSAHSLDQDPEKFVDLAAAVELMHIASLIHDDIIDDDAERRGKETVHVKYGRNMAILAGDKLIAEAIGLASKYGEIVVKRASEASRAMCEGEALDSERQRTRSQLDFQSYLKIAELKTASLIGISSSIVADYINDPSRDALYEFGFNVGLSFQLRDDIMNFLGVQDPNPKTTSNDMVNSRPNIVGVLTASKVPDATKEAIQLNNHYLEQAKVPLKKLRNSELFIGYLDFLEIKAEV